MAVRTAGVTATAVTAKSQISSNDCVVCVLTGFVEVAGGVWLRQIPLMAGEDFLLSSSTMFKLVFSFLEAFGGCSLLLIPLLRLLRVDGLA